MNNDVVWAAIIFALIGLGFVISWIKCVWDWYMNKSIKKTSKIENQYLILFPCIAVVMSIFCSVLSYRNPHQLIEYVPIWNEIMTIGGGIFVGSMTSGAFCLGNYNLLTTIDKIKKGYYGATSKDIIISLLLILLSLVFPMAIASIYIPQLVVIVDIFIAAAAIILNVLVLISALR